MKPVRLELQGFTAFREPAVIDFEGRRLFVITGPTGAGKSSLLDAMTWALFGQVPRVGASVGQLIAQGAPTMQVLLEFETRARRFRIARRADVKGPGRVRLERRDLSGAWEPLADKATEVRAHVERLLGMDYATFTRTMVLPQGAFDAFLRGEPKERREILSRLIGLDVYEAARQIAGSRASDAKTRAETLRAQLASLDLATPERIAALRSEHVEALACLAGLAARFEALRDLGDRWRAFEAAQRTASEAGVEAERAARAADLAAAALVEAEQAAARAQQDAKRAEAERARLAYDREAHEALRVQVALLDQRDAAQRYLEVAQAALVTAEKQNADAETAASAAVRRAKQAERVSLQAQTKAETAVAQVIEAAAAAVASRDRHLAEAGVHTAEAVAAREAAAAAEARALAVGQAATRLAAEVEAERVAAAAHAEALREAKSAVRDAGAAAKAHTAAERAFEAARQKAEAARRADAAAAISRGLKKGDRCPICGEVLTAAPKHAKGDLDLAERALAEAERILREAAAASSAASSTAAVAAARVEARASAVAIATGRRAEVERLVADIGVSLAELPRQAQREQKAAEQAVARAQQAEQAAAKASTAAHAFEVALGALVETTPGDAEPATSPAVLVRAIEAQAAAEHAAREAASALEKATHEADAAQREVALRGQAVHTAREHEAAARQRLAALGAVEGNAAAVRAAFEAAEQASARASALDVAVAKARTACAAADASAASAQAAVETARAAAGERGARLLVQRDAEQEAQRAVMVEWPAVMGEEVPSKAVLAAAQRAHQAEQEAATLRAGALGQAVVQAEQQAEQAAATVAAIGMHEGRQQLAAQLHTELQSNHFVDFLLRESLGMLARDASVRLMQFSTGRYELATEKGDFFVVDHQNGDEQRSVRTLSGGETFLASLALALSLSEHLPEISGTGGAVSLESLFLDEGFGSLDAESLDLAVQGLEALADGNRMVGVISHIEELSERMPSRVHVEKHAHSSTIREDGLRLA
ncbi:MAG: SMC family ATPase [Dehalococcoidia bacterium]|nr:MAG: SMC family ATPase [Dehalococcoidia bacterium]